ncbi:TonB-dependent receptor [Opitutus sp. ER46]|uniref:TonB-dependent receptor n=1 Tax=Opitutus sp. ER46 TaxID=2161864 RepID=UPI000D308E91|nr:TonB-dependent receptor [Opitutus sp. ER46]PTX92725.1 hypothetical protein DB354_15510 [Opitutus sp. ER46]
MQTHTMLRRACFLLAAFVTLCGVASGQTSTGSIQGRVLDAATNRYLNNARVTVSGTNVSAFTNEYGEYRIHNLPPGEVSLDVFYSGLPPQNVKVQVPAGQVITQDVSLGRAADQPIVLEAMTVKSGRETNLAAIAVNEQRFAPNIKTVIESDAFGDVAEGNVGEFLKFLPGVTVDYVAADVRTVSVRGFGAQFSSVYVDGFRMASAASGSAIRAFEFEQVSINNAARIEVAKVPTPAMPADALGGSVNMISKNAFEREGAQFNYRAYVNFNSEDPKPFDKSPGPSKKPTYKVLPGADFDLTLPLSKNVGLVVTGLTSNQFNEQHRSQPQWNYAQGGGTYTPTGGGAVTLPTATATNPYLQQYQMQDGPKNSFRDSFSAKVDWRISPESTFWAGYQFNWYHSFFGNRNLTWEAGTNGAPTTAAGTPLAWGPGFTESASGRGSVRHGTSFRDKYGQANALLAKYRYNGRTWEFDAGAGYSTSKSWYRDTGDDHFSEVRTTLQGVSRVLFSDYREDRPNTIRAVTAAGADIDPYNLANYRLNTVRSNPLDARDEFTNAHANVARELNFLPFTAKLRGGIDVRRQDRDIQRYDTTWNFVGPDGVANSADDNAATFLDESYGPYSGWGFDNVQWPSPHALYDAFKNTSAWFVQTADQARNAERFRIQNSQRLRETISAAYLQAEAKLLNNRLTLVGGVRFEKTEDRGNGPLTPTPGLTLADVRANWRERGLHVDESYDGYYPSLHATYEITPDLLVRAAYAATLGRPDFGNILPLVRANLTSTQANDGVGDLDPGLIRYNNTELKPYEADNYDVSLEYYFRNGGLASVGLFRKDIDGFFETRQRAATLADFTALGLDPSLMEPGVNYVVASTFNSASMARITGVELNFRLPLTFIPRFGEYLTFFANATKLDLDGSAQADFRGFIEESANAGITYSRNPLTLRINANFRGRQINSPQGGGVYGTGAGFNEYYAARVNFDVNVEYRLSRKLALFGNVRNIFNEPQDLERYNSVSPGYARLYRREKFGAQITLGVKGTF